MKGRTTVYNNITDETKIKNINPENMSLLKDFLEYLQSVGRANSTIHNYRADLLVFFCWCEDELNNKYFVELTKREISRFQNHALNVWGWSSNRLRTVKAAISSLSNFIENILDDEIQGYKPIVRKIESPPKQAVRDKTVYEEEEIENLLHKLVELNELDKACFIALAAYSGRRKAELCRFRVSDFDDDKLVCDGGLYRSDPIRTKGRGNGKYIPCYVLAKKFKPYFDLWMKFRKENGIESEWLFPMKTDCKEQMKTHTVDRWCDELSELTGKPFYPHSLRHGFCTMLARAGFPDSVITEIVGWESAAMVQVYNDAPKDELISAYFKDGDIAVQKEKNISDL